MGVRRSARAAANLERITAFTAAAAILVCDVATAAEYGELKAVLRAQGTPIPENAIWIAALAWNSLKAGLALPPTERLRRAEELLQLARSVRPRTTRKQIIAFENWEDFATWKAARRINL